MGSSDRIVVSVVYALPRQQTIVELSLPSGATVADAVMLARAQRHFLAVDTTELRCAVFGTAVALDHRVQAGDRIEILRPLLIDPKLARRQAASTGRPRQKR